MTCFQNPFTFQLRLTAKKLARTIIDATFSHGKAWPTIVQLSLFSLLHIRIQESTVTNGIYLEKQGNCKLKFGLATRDGGLLFIAKFPDCQMNWTLLQMPSSAGRRSKWAP